MTLSLLITFLLMSVPSAGGQPPAWNWARVVSLPSGTDVVISKVGDGQTMSGRIMQADEFTVTVQNPRTHHQEAVAREDVLEISTAKRTSPGKRGLGLIAALGGAVGGAYAGAHVGAKVGGCGAENLGCMSVGMTAGAAGGAIGAFRAVTRTQRVLIYRRP
jgi:hypothetical protein